MAVDDPAERPLGTEPIREPTPGAILRKRAFGDWGMLLGGGFMLFLLLLAIAGSVADLARPAGTGSAQPVRPSGLA